MKLSEIICIAKNKDYKKMELIYDGTQVDSHTPRSHVYRIENFCIKYYIKSKEIDFKTEINNLTSLEEYNFAPKLYYSDNEDYFIIMEYIEGIPLGKVRELSEEQYVQLKNIKNILKTLGIYYEKEDIHCIIEPSGNLRFIDFNL